MNKEQEQIIINKVRAGESACYKELIDAYGNELFALVYKMVENREDAQELVQDTFVKAFFSLKKFREESAFSTWLYRISYNLAISKLRKEKRVFLKDLEQVNVDVEDESEEQLEHKQLTERKFEQLERAKEQLSPDERFLIYAFYEQEKSLAEIAQITGLSFSNTKVKLFRTRKKIEELVKNDNKNQE